MNTTKPAKPDNSLIAISYMARQVIGSKPLTSMRDINFIGSAISQEGSSAVLIVDSFSNSTFTINFPLLEVTCYQTYVSYKSIVPMHTGNIVLTKTRLHTMYSIVDLNTGRAYIKKDTNAVQFINNLLGL